MLLAFSALVGCAEPQANEPLKDLLKGIFQKPAAGAIKASVTVLPQEPAGVVPAGIFGTNLQWENDGDGLLRGLSGNQFPAAVVADVRTLAPTSVRFPGGLLANTYRWKTGIGERSGRAKGLGFSGQPMASTFGTDEYMALLAATGAAPLITVNVSAGAEEAADWVEYWNGAPGTRWGRLRQTNTGIKPPRAMHWEIGNELYTPGHPGFLTAEAYAAKVNEFAVAMKKRDPTIKIGATMEGSFQEAAWMASVIPDLTTWNQRVLKALGPEVDFLTVHFYVPFGKFGSEDDLNRLVWAGPATFERTVSRILAQAREHGHPELEIAVTEFGTFFGETVTLSERISGTENAIFNTLLTMAFIRQPGVTIANHWSLLNNGMFGMLTWDNGKLGRRPWTDVYARLREFAGAQRVAVRVESDGFPIPANGNVPEFAKLPAIDAIAVKVSGQMRLVLVNRSPDREAEVLVNGEGGQLPAKFSLTTLRAERNQLRWAAPVVATLTRAEGSDAYALRLPAQSVSFLAP
ncbi:MAG: hypothetical protein ACT4P0_04275 [Panacagrimonas sp.]